HFGLRVADLGRSLAFYRAVGYEVVGSVPETAVPLVSWSRGVGFSCHGGCLLELYRGQHAEAAVAALSVVEDLQVLKDRIRQLDAGAPAVSVQQLDLHPRPERLDHGVVVAVADRPHRGHQPRVLGPLGERPG